MKKYKLLLIALGLMLALALTACGDENKNNTEAEQKNEVSEKADNSETNDALVTDTPVPTKPPVYKDYAGELKLDMFTSSKKQQVTVKQYVDGDTVHFNIPRDQIGTDVLKARFLGINTPESTGKIEAWGKKASNFTKEILKNATSIVLESDDENWNVDSTGGRYLVWVWYRTSETEDYRNLNIEILQNGLAIASNSANNRYGSVCMSAIQNARDNKLNIYSGEKDPDFFYGDAIELDLKELRMNVEDYSGMKVAFEGVITRASGNGVYVEEYDADSDMYYGIYVYYGFSLTGSGLDILSVGNRSRIVGTVSKYETSGEYQVSGLTYRQMKPNDPSNIQKISEGNKASFRNIDAYTFNNGQIVVETEDGDKYFKYSRLAMNTTVVLENLDVLRIEPNTNEDSSSFGALTMYCEQDGNPIEIRTIVMYDKKGNLVTEDEFLGRNITVYGIVDCFKGYYQIKVLSYDDIIVNR
ncbi:MAG: thermonuclease family protein [Lachnospiraceae bacterium]|nr:thermonuclease family protein [Lachnospiraceae bacterium]